MAAARLQLVGCVYRFVTCVKEELLSIQLVRMKSKQSRDHSDSDYVSRVEVDRKGAEFTADWAWIIWDVNSHVTPDAVLRDRLQK